MSKQNDSDFEDYLAGKSPLSEIYQRSPSAGPSQAIDQTILAAARAETQHTPSRTATVGNKFNWYVPMAMAASLIVAVGVVRFYFIDVDDNTSGEIAINTADPMDKSIGISAAGRSSPERILDSISELLAHSQTDKAKEQYDAFTILFPKYKIDYQRYPNLLKLKPDE